MMQTLRTDGIKLLCTKIHAFILPIMVPFLLVIMVKLRKQKYVLPIFPVY